METKGYISEFMGGGRIVSHGKITDLSSGFSLPKGELFSIYVRPKVHSEAIDVVLSVRCYQDENAADAPIILNDWSPLAIAEIAANASILTDYDIYWGSGQHVANE